jgi:phosphate transport system substrate-binding protein
MISAGAFRGVMLFGVIWLSTVAGARPGLAQNNTVGAYEVEVCSKGDPNYPRQRGTLLQLDPKNFVVQTGGGQQTFHRDDFYVCPPSPSQPPPRIEAQCPPGQIAGANGCACPVNQIMQEGRCAAAPAPVVMKNEDALPVCRSAEEMTVQGSSTVGLGVMPSLIKAFAAANNFTVATGAEDTRAVFQLRPAASREGGCFVIIVLSTGSNDAKTGITKGTAQMGMSSRDYTDSEIDEMASQGDKKSSYSRGDIERVVALDAVGIVVNKRNPIAALELCQIAEVFAGKTRNWRDLGGHSSPIKIHVTTEASQVGNARSGTFETFERLVLKSCGVTLGSGFTLHDTYPDLLRAVANDDASIGFAPAVLAKGAPVAALHLRGKCGIEQESTTFNVKTEDYPLSRRLYLFRPFTLSGQARQFETFILTDDRADDAVNRDSSAVDQKIESVADLHASSSRTSDTAADPRSHAAFNTMARDGERLSITYRFAFGKDELDTKARQDILRLARYLKKLPGPPPTVVLAGFADNVGSVRANIELAERRAEQVRQALLAALPGFAGHVRVQGYGKILPVTCNDNELGQSKNRRVEVYLQGR